MNGLKLPEVGTAAAVTLLRLSTRNWYGTASPTVYGVAARSRLVSMADPEICRPTMFSVAAPVTVVGTMAWTAVLLTLTVANRSTFPARRKSGMVTGTETVLVSPAAMVGISTLPKVQPAFGAKDATAPFSAESLVLATVSTASTVAPLAPVRGSAVTLAPQKTPSQAALNLAKWMLSLLPS